MSKILFDIFTYLLAAYGLIYLTISVINSIRQRLGSESTRVKMVLLIKNQERTIEGIIRNIFTGDVLRKVMSNEKLIVLDMGSSDSTVDILRKLKDDYGFFDIIGENEKFMLFSKFNSDEAGVKSKVN
ncbi:MAG: hypothetical protein N3I35_07340 [Clostridia bacterium]|nr:hypothetical protein [Clostridia bacterium]